MFSSTLSIDSICRRATSVSLSSRGEGKPVSSWRARGSTSSLDMADPGFGSKKPRTERMRSPPTVHARMHATPRIPAIMSRRLGIAGRRDTEGDTSDGFFEPTGGRGGFGPTRGGGGGFGPTSGGGFGPAAGGGSGFGPK